MTLRALRFESKSGLSPETNDAGTCIPGYGTDSNRQWSLVCGRVCSLCHQLVSRPTLWISTWPAPYCTVRYGTVQWSNECSTGRRLKKRDEVVARAQDSCGGDVAHGCLLYLAPHPDTAVLFRMSERQNYIVEHRAIL